MCDLQVSHRMIIFTLLVCLTWGERCVIGHVSNDVTTAAFANVGF